MEIEGGSPPPRLTITAFLASIKSNWITSLLSMSETGTVGLLTPDVLMYLHWSILPSRTFEFFFAFSQTMQPDTDIKFKFGTVW